MEVVGVPVPDPVLLLITVPEHPLIAMDTHARSRIPAMILVRKEN